MKSTEFWNTVEFILAQKDALYGCSSKQGFTVECILFTFRSSMKLDFNVCTRAN